MIEYLRSHRPGFFHTVDPFKVSENEACQKAEFLSGYSPFLVLGSTDCPSFTPTVPRFVKRLRNSFDGALLTHFLPQEDTQKVPYCSGADAILFSSVLNSVAPHIRQPALETAVAETKVVRTAAVAFGADKKTAQYAKTCEVAAESSIICNLISDVIAGEYQALYLFSRTERLSAEFCYWVRKRLPDDLVLFVGGQVKSSAQLSELVDAGADYVAVGSALEGENWEEVAKELCIWASKEESPARQELVPVLLP